MPDYTLMLNASATSTDDLARMLEAAADRVRHQNQDDDKDGGLVSVSGVSESAGTYRFVIATDDPDPDHFAGAGWRGTRQNDHTSHTEHHRTPTDVSVATSPGPATSAGRSIPTGSAGREHTNSTLRRTDERD